MKSKIHQIAIAILLLIFYSSCEKKGCTHYLATNYDQSAKVDNGSCEFETRAVFYTASANGGGNIELWVDGNSVGVLKRYSRTANNVCIKGNTLEWIAPKGTYHLRAYQKNTGQIYNSSFDILEPNCTIIGVFDYGNNNLPAEGAMEYNVETRIDSISKGKDNEIKIINNCDVNYLIDVTGRIERDGFYESGQEQIEEYIPDGEYYFNIRYHNSSKIGVDGSCKCATHSDKFGPFNLSGAKQLVFEVKPPKISN